MLDEMLEFNASAAKDLVARETPAASGPNADIQNEFDKHTLIGKNGMPIRPVGFRKGRPVYSHVDVANMEPRYSENRCE